MTLYKVEEFDESITKVREIDPDIYAQECSNKAIRQLNHRCWTAYRKPFGMKTWDATKVQVVYYIRDFEKAPSAVRLAILRHEYKKHKKYMSSRGFK